MNYYCFLDADNIAQCTLFQFASTAAELFVQAKDKVPSRYLCYLRLTESDEKANSCY